MKKIVMKTIAGYMVFLSIPVSAVKSTNDHDVNSSNMQQNVSLLDQYNQNLNGIHNQIDNIFKDVESKKEQINTVATMDMVNSIESSVKDFALAFEDVKKTPVNEQNNVCSIKNVEDNTKSVFEKINKLKQKLQPSNESDDVSIDALNKMLDALNLSLDQADREIESRTQQETLDTAVESAENKIKSIELDVRKYKKKVEKIKKSLEEQTINTSSIQDAENKIENILKKLDELKGKLS